MGLVLASNELCTASGFVYSIYNFKSTTYSYPAQPEVVFVVNARKVFTYNVAVNPRIAKPQEEYVGNNRVYIDRGEAPQMQDFTDKRTTFMTTS